MPPKKPKQKLNVSENIVHRVVGSNSSISSPGVVAALSVVNIANI